MRSSSRSWRSRPCLRRYAHFQGKGPAVELLHRRGRSWNNFLEGAYAVDAPYQMGIDLGTTFSSVAVIRGDRVDVLGIGANSSVVVPSVVFIGVDGERVIGEAAEGRGRFIPTRVARRFKRTFTDPTKHLFGIQPDEALSSADLSALLLGQMYMLAVQRMGEAPTNVVVTHPATWGPLALEKIAEVAKRAGLPQATEFRPEPVAAAVDYAASNALQDGAIVGVCDFGGGTFDVALVQRRGDTYVMLGQPQGLHNFGGIDVDDAVFEFVQAKVNDDTVFESTDPAMLSELAVIKADCRRAKEHLSETGQDVINVSLPRLRTAVTITNMDLDRMVRPRLNEIVQAIQRAVSVADISMEDVSRLVLVGGSSRMPIVRTELQQAFGREVHVNADPETTIARGAARLAVRRVATPTSPPLQGSRVSKNALIAAAAIVVAVLVLVAVMASGRSDNPTVASATSLAVIDTVSTTAAAVGASTTTARGTTAAVETTAIATEATTVVKTAQDATTSPSTQLATTAVTTLASPVAAALPPLADTSTPTETTAQTQTTASSAEHLGTLAVDAVPNWGQMKWPVTVEINGQAITNSVEGVYLCDTQPPFVEFNLSRKYQTFSATAGVVDTAPSGTRVEFRVIADDQTVWTKQLGLGEASAINISVKNVLRLRLEVSYAGSRCDRTNNLAAFGDPTVR